MTRILLATEGQSEEVVAIHILTHLCPGAQIDPKKYTNRGFQAVRRSAPVLARAAYFGGYDILVVHFDLDDTLSITDTSKVADSERWQDIYDRIHTTINTFPAIGRTRALRVALMAPCQSTDAWLTWGTNSGDGKQWERRPRKDLKENIYGKPPRGVTKKASIIAPFLIQRMKEESRWPISLRAFESQIQAALV